MRFHFLMTMILTSLVCMQAHAQQPQLKFSICDQYPFFHEGPGPDYHWSCQDKLGKDLTPAEKTPIYSQEQALDNIPPSILANAGINTIHFFVKNSDTDCKGIPTELGASIDEVHKNVLNITSCAINGNSDANVKVSSHEILDALLSASANVSRLWSGQLDYSKLVSEMNQIQGHLTPEQAKALADTALEVDGYTPNQIAKFDNSSTGSGSLRDPQQ